MKIFNLQTEIRKLKIREFVAKNKKKKNNEFQ